MMSQSRHPADKTTSTNAKKPQQAADFEVPSLSTTTSTYELPSTTASLIKAGAQHVNSRTQSTTSTAILAQPSNPSYQMPPDHLTPSQAIEAHVAPSTIIASPPLDQNSQYIRKADITNPNASGFAAKVAELFNAYNLDINGNRMESFVTRSKVGGTQIKADEFRIVSVDNIPQLLTPADGASVFIDFTVLKGVQKSEVGTFKQNLEFIEAPSRFIVTVKKGEMAKAYIGPDNQPILLDEGTHVISSPSFHLKKENPYVNRFDTHIEHGPIHILNIPEGKLAKIVEANSTYKLLSSGRYTFNDAGFSLAENPFVNPLSEYIEHKTLHILNVPEGYVAKVIEKGIHYRLLPSGHHEFTDAGFKFVGPFVHSLEPYIEHGTLHVLNVPQGHLAKIVEKGVKYRLLEPGHHEFIDPGFTLHKHNASTNQLFVKMTENSISHGPIHRFMPSVTEVALVRKNNHLDVYKSRDNGPYILEGPEYSAPEFFNTNYREINLPSAATRKSMLAKYPDFPDAVNYQEFITRDKIAIGVKIHIRYSFRDIKLAIEKIGLNQIDGNIENAVAAALGNQIFSTDWNDMQDLSSNSTSKMTGLTPTPNIVNYINKLQNSILGQLQDQFTNAGIHIDILSIEAPKNLNNEVQLQLETSAKETAKQQAELARLTSETEILRAHAEQEKMKAIIAAQQAAEISKIQQDQTNQTQTSQAETGRLIAEAKAAAIHAAADAEKYKDTTAPVVAANKSELLKSENQNLVLKQEIENAKTRTALLEAKKAEALAELELARVKAELTKLQADTEAYSGLKKNEVKEDKLERKGRQYTKHPVLALMKVEQCRTLAMGKADKVIATPEALQGMYQNGIFGNLRFQQSVLPERGLTIGADKSVDEGVEPPKLGLGKTG